MLLVEPGAFRTKLLASNNLQLIPSSAAYEGTAVEKTEQVFKDMDGKQASDPVKGAQRIFEMVMGIGMGKGKTVLEVHDRKRLLGEGDRAGEFSEGEFDGDGGNCGEYQIRGIEKHYFVLVRCSVKTACDRNICQSQSRRFAFCFENSFRRPNEAFCKPA